MISAVAGRRPWKRPRTWAPGKTFFLQVKRLDYRFTLSYVPRWGYRPYSYVRDGASAGSVTHYPAPRYDEMKKRQPKVVPMSADTPASLASMESKLLKGFPNLLAHCAVNRYDDGTARRVGQIQISVHGPMWQVRAKDYDGGCQLTCVALSVEDALAELELLLGSDDAPWEQDHYQTARGTAKKK